MPRVHRVVKARKDNPAVKKGEPYYWWKFAYSPKRYSATRPKPWDLTQSAFLQDYYHLQEEIADIANEEDADEFRDKLEELRETCEDSLMNMPDHLQETSESGIMLQERIDGLEQWVSEVENIDWEDGTLEEAIETIQNGDPGF